MLRASLNRFNGALLPRWLGNFKGVFNQKVVAGKFRVIPFFFVNVCHFFDRPFACWKKFQLVRNNRHYVLKCLCEFSHIFSIKKKQEHRKRQEKCILSFPKI